ncbi:MAG TPA: hypothetical protein VHO01_17040 [Jatrophihabitans sp.]|nr:hypothetical protein [Jatrophihabitans sp.]
MRPPIARGRILIALFGLLLAGFIASPAASAGTTNHRASLSGTTTVSTAPGIATTLLKAGILPLPDPGTRLSLGYQDGLIVRYGFPITGGNPDLATGTGDILHSGGITFRSWKARLDVARFDIDLAAGKVFATQVNGKPARVALLDLDLSGLKVGSSHGRTVLSGIGLKLDPAGAGALNATFGISLPTDGSLLFGSATVALNS